MAAIDFSGNTMIVTAAASMNAAMLTVNIQCVTIWSVNTTAIVEVGGIDTGGFLIFRYSPDRSRIAPFSETLPWSGTFPQLSFNTVTACTAYIQMR